MRKAYATTKIPLGELKPLEEGVKESERAAQSYREPYRKEKQIEDLPCGSAEDR